MIQRPIFLRSLAWKGILLAPALVVLASSPLPAATAGDAEIPLGKTEKLSAGKFEWQPSRAPGGTVSVLVDLPTQMLSVLRGEVVIARSSISSGRAGHTTPSGIFTILGKEVMHYSNLYRRAPMPFMQRLTWEGVALHGGYLPGRPASHGCIRLPRAFAKLLFQITSCGDQVVVTNKPAPAAPDPPVAKPKAGARPASADAAPHVAADTPAKNAPKAADDAKTRARKSMVELEIEEVGIRNNSNLTRAERQTELLRVWSEQRALMGVR
jgi:hypothetical protein